MSRNLAAEVDALQRLCRGALELLRTEHGWHTFGSHVDRPDVKRVKLEFSKQLDPDGDPMFERVIQR